MYLRIHGMYMYTHAGCDGSALWSGGGEGYSCMQPSVRSIDRFDTGTVLLALMLNATCSRMSIGLNLGRDFGATGLDVRVYTPVLLKVFVDARELARLALILVPVSSAAKRWSDPLICFGESERAGKSCSCQLPAPRSIDIGFPVGIWDCSTDCGVLLVWAHYIKAQSLEFQQGKY